MESQQQWQSHQVCLQQRVLATALITNRGSQRKQASRFRSRLRATRLLLQQPLMLEAPPHLSAQTHRAQMAQLRRGRRSTSMRGTATYGRCTQCAR
jgi:hypothetical protein